MTSSETDRLQNQMSDDAAGAAACTPWTLGEARTLVDVFRGTPTDEPPIEIDMRSAMRPAAFNPNARAGAQIGQLYGAMYGTPHPWSKKHGSIIAVVVIKWNGLEPAERARIWDALETLTNSTGELVTEDFEAAGITIVELDEPEQGRRDWTPPSDGRAA